MWNKLAVKVDTHLMGIAMILALCGVVCLSVSPFSAIYFFLAVVATGLIRHFSLKGVAASIAVIALFSLIAYFSHRDIVTKWQFFWVVSLCIALYLVAEGQVTSGEKLRSQEASLKQERENVTLWKTRFETVTEKLQQEKDKIASLEQDMILSEEKHEERIEALKQLIELTSSESARHRHRLEHLLQERDVFEKSAQDLSIEIEELKKSFQLQKEPMFSDEESLKRLEALNEERFDNYQLRLLLTEGRKEQKIQEKVKRDRTPRAAAATGQEKITLQDLAKVISKNIR